MKQIKEFMKYNGTLKEGVLYTSTQPIKVVGNVTFRIFGNARLNTTKISNTEITALLSNGEIKLDKDSAIVFYKLPPPEVIQPEFIPVPDVPEYSDPMEESIHMMIHEYLHKIGFKGTGRQADDQLDDDENLDDMEDWEGHDLDEFSLIEEQVVEPIETEIDNETKTNEENQSDELQTERSDSSDVEAKIAS